MSGAMSRCIAATKAGKPCKNAAVQDNMCRVHVGATASVFVPKPKKTYPVCLICVEPCQYKDTTYTLPCDHIVHSYCIEKHILTTASCPSCNFVLTHVLSDIDPAHFYRKELEVLRSNSVIDVPFPNPKTKKEKQANAHAFITASYEYQSKVSRLEDLIFEAMCRKR
jgi:Ring finger domain